MPDPRKPIGAGIVGLSARGGWAAGAHLPALSAVKVPQHRELVLPVLKANAGALRVAVTPVSQNMVYTLGRDPAPPGLPRAHRAGRSDLRRRSTLGKR